MIELLLGLRQAEIDSLRAELAAKPKGDRGMVERVETAVAANPSQTIAFDPAGAAIVKAAGHRFAGGRFAVKSIGALRVEAKAALGAESPKRVRLSVLCGSDPLTDIGMLQAVAPPDSLFQVASQFNCLEAPDARLVPIRSYFADPTQGPRAAISAFPGTLVRHYAAPADDGTRFEQTGARQLDLLARALPAGGVRSGYLMAQEIPNLEAAAHSLHERFDEVRVGVHDRVQVVLGGDWDGPVEDGRRIAQVFASTFAGGDYSGGLRVAGAVEGICRSLLRAAYLGTLLAACALRSRNVVLTMIGGGAFGNPHRLIWESILWAADQADAVAGAPLEVVLNGREVLGTLGRDALLEGTRARGGVVVGVKNGRVAALE